MRYRSTPKRSRRRGCRFDGRLFRKPLEVDAFASGGRSQRNIGPNEAAVPPSGAGGCPDMVGSRGRLMHLGLDGFMKQPHGRAGVPPPAGARVASGREQQRGVACADDCFAHRARRVSAPAAACREPDATSLGKHDAASAATAASPREATFSFDVTPCEVRSNLHGPLHHRVDAAVLRPDRDRWFSSRAGG
jgi:hypothetical protein